MAIYKEVNMRAIKFRAWKSWRKSTMLYSGQFDIKWSAEIGRYQAIDRTRFDSQWDMPLMQYTGLKDKNGNEIYEGDILATSQRDVFFEVVYGWNGDGNTYGWNYKSLKRPKHRIYSMDKPDRLEIIGNIYENPELL